MLNGLEKWNFGVRRSDMRLVQMTEIKEESVGVERK